MLKQREKRMRVATSNMMSLPRHDNSIKSVVDQSTGPWIEITGWQECNNEVYRAALRALKDYTTIFARTEPSFSCPISLQYKDWVFLRGGFEKLYDGVRGISKTRHLEWVHLKLKTDSSMHLVVINLHSVAVRNNNPKALELRKEARQVLDKVVARFVKAGIPIIVMGDTNTTNAWFLNVTKTVPIRRAQTVSNRVDHMTFINGRDYRWKLKGKKLRDSSSDHDVLLADVSLILK